MKKIIKKHKTKILITLSLLIPLIIYTTIFYINGLLTDKTIMSGDMYAQYFPLYNYLKEVFNGTANLFYSFSKGLGGPMTGTIFYYLSSPLNLFIILVDKQSIPQFMTLLIILKMSLCGLTMYLYMRRKFKKDNLTLLIFSLLYSFMGYNLNYFINIMWIDVVIMTPLVLIGLEKILEDKSPMLYMTMLFISIFSNYYISYMLCLFCVLYFIYEILLKYNMRQDKQIIKKLTKKFIISSLLTGLLCSFFLIPCIFEMLNYGRIENIHKVFKFDLNFFNIISKSYIGTLILNNTLNPSSMNIYTGVITLPLVFLFITNKNIDKKKRKLTILLISTMILPCFVEILNYIWHLLTITSSYNYRYSFLLCLFLIRIAYESIININISMKKILFYLSLYLIASLYFIIITYFSSFYDFLNYKLIWLTLVFLFTYFGLMLIMKNKKSIIYVILVLILFENILNISIIFKNSEHYENMKPEEMEISKIIQKYIGDGHRIETTIHVTLNDAILMNYSGTKIFLSTLNDKNLKFIYDYGFNEYNKEHPNMYKGINNYMLESILGLRYIISDEKISNYKLVEETKVNDQNIYVYENPNSIGYGTMVNDKCNNISNEVLYSQDLFNCLFDVNYELFKEYKSKDDEYKIETDYYYVFINNVIETNFLKLNQDLKDNIYYKSDNYIIYKKDKDKIKFVLDETIEKENFKVMYFDYKLFSTVKYDKFNVEYKNNNSIKGNITATKDGVFMINIPYEDGYSVYVDNNKVNCFEVANTFIGVDLEKGNHSIEIKYNQPKIKIGICVSICTLLVSIVYICSERKKNEKICK